MLHPRRKWQDEVVVAAQRILIFEGKDHLYIQAPTASGKSRAMFEIIEHVPVIGEHRIIVGRGAIVSQHIDSFVQEFSCIKIDDTTVKTPSGKIVQIDTLQSLTAKAKKNICINPTGYLFFDECHLGGSGEDVLSIPIIFSHYAPAKKCYVSATTLTVNQKILGNKVNHTYVYTMSEAMDDGILHAVDLVEIHTGTNAKIARLNNSLQAHGSNLQKLDELYESDCESMVNAFNQKKVGFDTAIFDVYKEVIDLRGESAMQVYIAKHFGERAQMYFGNITNAENANRKFQTMILKSKLGNCRSSTLHSKMDDQLQASIIADFISGKIKVLFLVNMLQEGFSLKPLSLAFDCTFRSDWNDSSISRLIQRVGRLMRVDQTKVEPSKYYFFRDILNYLVHSPEMPTVDDSHGSMDDAVFSEIDTTESENFAAKVAATAQNQEIAADDPSLQDKEADIYPATIEDLNVFEIDKFDITVNKKIILVSSPLWVLKNLRGHTEKRTISYSSLFYKSPSSADIKKKTLLEMARNGDPRPRYYIDKNNENPQDILLGIRRNNASLDAAIRKYTTSNSKAFDPTFNKEIRELAPQWFESSSDINKQKLLEMARNGEKRPAKKASGALLYWYTNSNTKTFDPIFNKEIRELAPHWFENSVEINKQKLLDMARNGEKRPTSKKRNTLVPMIGNALCSYLNATHGSFDPIFSKEIRELAPHWFENSADINREKLLEMARNGEPRPKARTTMGGLLVNYNCRTSRSFSADFDKEIRELAPHWFKTKKSAVQ